MRMRFKTPEWVKDTVAAGFIAAGLIALSTPAQAVLWDQIPYRNITAATTTTVKSGTGVLRGITVNTQIASATITIYDSLTGTGTKIGTITLPSTITGEVAPTYDFKDLVFGTGLTIVTSGATDITVTYR